MFTKTEIKAVTDSPYLTTEEAAERCGGITERHFRRLAQRVGLKPRNTSRHRLWRKDEVDYCIETCWVLPPRRERQGGPRGGRPNNLEAVCKKHGLKVPGRGASRKD